MEKISIENKSINNKQNDKNEIRIVYKPQTSKNKRTKLFSSTFVTYNKYNCRIVFKDLEYNLVGYFNLEDINEIKLKINKTLTNIKHMFSECESLLYIEGLDKIDTSNITDMSHMFFECKNLCYLPDISNWNTSKVTKMEYMFCGCSSLSLLPDIGKWDISSVTDINHIFFNCSSLTFLPDMSNWDTKNIKCMNEMFNGCISLSYLPNNEKWVKNCEIEIKNLFCINCLHNYIDNFLEKKK